MPALKEAALGDKPYMVACSYSKHPGHSAAICPELSLAPWNQCKTSNVWGHVENQWLGHVKSVTAEEEEGE